MDKAQAWYEPSPRLTCRALPVAVASLLGAAWEGGGTLAMRYLQMTPPHWCEDPTQGTQQHRFTRGITLDLFLQRIAGRAERATLPPPDTPTTTRLTRHIPRTLLIIQHSLCFHKIGGKQDQPSQALQSLTADKIPSLTKQKSTLGHSGSRKAR